MGGNLGWWFAGSSVHLMHRPGPDVQTGIVPVKDTAAGKTSPRDQTALLGTIE